MNSTKLTKDKKGYTLIHQGKVLVNGLNVDDVYSIIPELSLDDVQKVREGKVLSVKSIRNFRFKKSVTQPFDSYLF